MQSEFNPTSPVGEREMQRCRGAMVADIEFRKSKVLFREHLVFLQSSFDVTPQSERRIYPAAARAD